MNGTIHYEPAVAYNLPDSQTTVDHDRQIEITRELRPVRGTMYGLLVSAALWAMIVIPVWFLVLHH